MADGVSGAAGALALLSLLFLLTRRLWTIERPAAADGLHEPGASIVEALRRPLVWMQLPLFFLYCGVESTAGQLLYSLFTESRGMAPTTAGLATGGYWASLTAGRFVFGQLAATVSRGAILRIGLCLAPVGAALLWWNAAVAVSVAGAALLGFALAPIFPTLISITPQRVGGRYAAQAVGFQVAVANLGIAVLPWLVAVEARRVGLEFVCVFLVAGSLLLLVMQEAVMRLTYRVDTSAALS